MHLGEPFYLVHRAQEKYAPDSRWTLELNSSVIELKLKLSPCCSGPHLFRVLAAARPVKFRGPERLFRGRMKEAAAAQPVQSAGVPAFANETQL